MGLSISHARMITRRPALRTNDLIKTIDRIARESQVTTLAMVPRSRPFGQRHYRRQGSSCEHVAPGKTLLQQPASESLCTRRTRPPVNHRRAL